MQATEAMTTETHVRVSRDGGVMTIRLDRPAKRNALTYPMYAAMADALGSASADKSVRAVLLAGSPKSFCAGHDMHEFHPVVEPGQKSPDDRFYEALIGLDKPVVAAVCGMAIGVGFTTLLHCDLVYVAEGARLQLPFVNIGLCPDFAASWVLPRLLGAARAAELLLLGEPVAPEWALRNGVVNAVLPPAEVETKALECAHRLARQPPHALRTTKRLCRRWLRAHAEEAIALENRYLDAMMEGPEMAEAVAAFTDKREPDYSSFE